MVIDFDTVIPKFEAILARGLSPGLGSAGGQVCIEAAICEAMGLPHGDNPQCVSVAVRSYKISLNDCDWSSPHARAQGLHDLGIAQLGSLGIVDDHAFTTRLSELTIRVLIPRLFREIFPNNHLCLEAALACEQQGTGTAANQAAEAASWAANRAASWAAGAASWAARAAANQAAEAASWAARAANQAAEAASWAANRAAANQAAEVVNLDFYLQFSASLSLQVLRELKSPGVAYLDKLNGQ